MTAVINVGSVKIGTGQPLAMIAGLCVIESREICLDLAERLCALAAEQDIPLIFKASFDKANRTSGDSFRGPGLEAGLKVLAEVREKYNVPVLTDVHETSQVKAVADVVDVMQLPAFLCRQTDLVEAMADSGKVIAVKKGQFLAPEDMEHVVKKIESRGNKNILLMERGASFGYHNLVADMRSLLIMRELGYPVLFDATHSVQRPGGANGRSSGDGRWAPALARAAVATGCDGVFVETHVDPTQALSDKDNAIAFAALPALWRSLQAIDQIVSGS